MAGNFAEFFAGIGLMRLGLERAGWFAEFANDIDPAKCEMYRDQFGENEDKLILGDVHSLQENEVPTVDLATASFPCADLSLAGSRSGLSGKQSSAFWGFISLMAKLGGRRPRIILLENVPAFISSNEGKDFIEAMKALNGLGYSVDPFILNAAHWVPQSRQRLFIVARLLNQDCVRERPNQRSFYESNVRPKAVASVMFAHPEVNWSVRDLPALPERNLNLRDLILEVGVEAEQWWDVERTRYLLGQMSERHAKKLRDLQESAQTEYATVFRRVRNGITMAELRADGIAGCLRTPKGGSAKQILVRIQGKKVTARHVTARECAHLMGAPNYTIKVPENQALFGFGDAVCVDAVEWIANNYLNLLLEEIEQMLSSVRGAYSAAATT